MKLTRYEQSALFLETLGRIRVAIDFGKDVPTATPARYGAAHASLVSHRHPDHLHSPHLVAFGGTVYAPADVSVLLEALDLELETVTAGSQISIGDLSVTFFNSDHGPNLSAPVESLGMVLWSQHTRVLYLGDMAVPSEVPPGAWDAVLIPVGGSKVFTPEQAASFVRDIRDPGIVIPIHYDGQAHPTSAHVFRNYASTFCDVRILDVGAELDL